MNGYVSVMYAMNESPEGTEFMLAVPGEVVLEFEKVVVDFFTPHGRANSFYLVHVNDRGDDMDLTLIDTYRVTPKSRNYDNVPQMIEAMVIEPLSIACTLMNEYTLGAANTH